MTFKNNNSITLKISVIYTNLHLLNNDTHIGILY